MIVFLTGDRQIGKSTVIRKILSRCPELKLGGYFTELSGLEIMMRPASGASSESFAVGWKGRQGFPDVFDSKGAELLLNSENADLILMDEIGWMETDARIFSSEILRIVHSGANVLGVIRKGCDTALCNALRAAECVEVIEITAENRDDLAESLGEKFVQEFEKKQRV